MFSSTESKFNNKLLDYMTQSSDKSLHIRPWRSFNNKVKKKTPKTLAKLQLSLNSMIISDQLNTQIKSTMKFGNLVARNFTGCIYPGLILKRNVSFPMFPSYLGKIGSINKMKRYTTECRALFANSQTGKI